MSRRGEISTNFRDVYLPIDIHNDSVAAVPAAASAQKGKKNPKQKIEVSKNYSKFNFKSIRKERLSILNFRKIRKNEKIVVD